MKLNNHLSLVLCFSLVLTFSFQSCSESGTPDSTTIDKGMDKIKETISKVDPATKTKDKNHGEMSKQEYSEFVAKHEKHLSFVNEKIDKIISEHIDKKDQFEFECANGEASLERIYNDDGEVHLLTTVEGSKDGKSSSAKHYYFWENKLIYQFHHHVVDDGSTVEVDDHQTFFKDGEMLKCLEKKYSYKKNESEPQNVPYKLVDLNPASKLTKDMEKLLRLPEGDIKGFLCS